MAVALEAAVESAPEFSGPTGFRRLHEQLERYLDLEQIQRIYRAFLFSSERHGDQRRYTGEPYITHPLAVAETLAELHLDADTIIAALLHDVIEDTLTAQEQIGTRFGEDVAHLVEGVSKLTLIGGLSRGEAQAANFSKMMLATVRDIRVILVKLADRLHNVRTLSVLPLQKRQRIATETLDVYVPIARRLGMNTVCQELESRAFEAMYPLRSQVLSRAMESQRKRQRNQMEQARSNLLDNLRFRNIEAQVESREKSAYSIYCKMRDKRCTFSEVYDVFGFRVIVGTVDECYRALGVAHSLYKPIPGKFKDYIAIPKANGYQSLHTALHGPGAVPLELQVRTDDMERVAESGVAAHWKYKDAAELALPAHAARWLQNVEDLQRTAPDSLEFLEQVKVDLFPHEVYVFTPKGDILRLPHGATALDFAYAVHSDVGDTCVGVKIDRVSMPLSSELSSGQMVEAITAAHGKPTAAWLDFAVTAKARTAIRQYLKGLKEEQAAALGQRLLDRALARFDLNFTDVPAEQITQALKTMGLADEEQLFCDIGLGRIMAPIAAHHLAGGATFPQGSPAWWKRVLRRQEKAPVVALVGTEGMAVSFSKCCRPIPGDAVVGMTSIGHGLVIHRGDCRNISGRRNKTSGQWIPFKWADTVEGEYSVAIRVSTNNRRGLLAQIAAAIAAQDSNIDGVELEEAQGSTTSLGFILNVRDRAHLASLIKAIRRLPDVRKVERLSG